MQSVEEDEREKPRRARGSDDVAGIHEVWTAHAPKPIEQLDEESFDRVIAVDLEGCFLCMKYELQHMVKAGKGVIVNTASVAGLLPEAGSGGYVAAKHGVVGREYGRFGNGVTVTMSLSRQLNSWEVDRLQSHAFRCRADLGDEGQEGADP